MTKEIPCSCSDENCENLLTLESQIDKEDGMLEVMFYNTDGDIGSIMLNRNSLIDLRDHLNKVLGEG
jgi:hypothetical protein